MLDFSAVSAISAVEIKAVRQPNPQNSNPDNRFRLGLRQLPVHVFTAAATTGLAFVAVLRNDLAAASEQYAAAKSWLTGIVMSFHFPDHAKPFTTAPKSGEQGSGSRAHS